MIHLLASEPHYLDHLAPVWFALPVAERGRVWVTGRLSIEPDTLGAHGLGVFARGVPPTADLCLVASLQDCRAHKGPAVYLEHGAGQRYVLDDGTRDASYAGGPEHGNVRLFLCPREEVAGWWREAYPDAAAVAVGCPKLDGVSRARDSVRAPAVAISFHHDSRLLPETASAWPLYREALPEIVDRLAHDGVEVLGHGHPRLWSQIGPWWDRIGVEPVESFDEVVRRATVYVCDNSSTLPEAAAHGLSLVWMESRHWRRDVEHGGRFWSWPAGQAVAAGPEHLRAAVMTAIKDPPDCRAAREKMLGNIYLALDGRAAERAAAAILEIHEQAGRRA